ncbi:extracellular solute-binding protein [Acidiphilium sp. AL]|uniref:Extracellular solute-binding protein n=1 Tax=Acidiphilium iwatense TaxID=768198 RepID=A0ABS9DT55_9PROT|nr:MULTISPECIES: extracellular solute-binding protein [Acidiphilium]MCF3945915.1 extracellular solute-binding protein [Acidiphilium iwatense]MCU4159204.1 extracellular solute-binding protein [Acidiphilium sp. AL]
MRKLIALAVGLVVVAFAIFLLLPGTTKSGLVFYSPLRGAPAIVKSFTRKTGIPVRLVTAERGHPRWSLAWVNTAGRPISPQFAGQPAAVFVVPGTTTFPPPARWADLSAPAYRGTIGMADPSVSVSDYPVLAAMLDSAGGWPAGKGFIATLQRNGLHIYATDRATLAALRSGAIQLAIVRPDAAAIYAGTIDKSLRVIVPRPAYAIQTTIVMAKTLTGQHRAAAEKLIAYVNSAAPSKPLITSTPTRRPAIAAWFVKTIMGSGPQS